MDILTKIVNDKRIEVKLRKQLIPTKQLEHSVLTDGKYFGGSLDDLLTARSSCNLPLLRKEFIIDEYQILEAKAYGADVILLIAPILTKSEIKQFSEFAKSLNLDVLLEIHNETKQIYNA